jgi:arylsulfatase A-like enzyme
VLDDGYADMAQELLGAHKPAGPYRGGKYSAFEAGTRVPFIVAWPGKIQPQTSDALISQVDIYRSLATIVGAQLPDTEAIDSEDQSEAFTGKSQKGREWMLEESYTVSARKANWKYIAPVAQDKKIPGWMANKGVESGLDRAHQLYNLESDAGEKVNMANSKPELVSEMAEYIRFIENRKTAKPWEKQTKN